MLQKLVGDMLTDTAFTGAFLSALVIILLGFALRRRGTLGVGAKHAVSTILLRVAIPCMAFNAFMAPFNAADITGSLWVLALTAALYILVLAAAWAALRRRLGADALVGALLAALGQITLFSMPILRAMYAENAADVMLAANMMTLVFRLMLYVVAYTAVARAATPEGAAKPAAESAGAKSAAAPKKRGGMGLRNALINPVMLFMLAGLAIWVTQGVQPRVAVAGGVAPLLRIDQTLPALYAVSTTLEKCVTPLAMLLVGLDLGEGSLRDAAQDGGAWLLALLRAAAAPLAMAGLMLAVRAAFGVHFTEGQTMALLLGTAAPTSATLAVFCMQFHRQEALAARVCFLSTLLCLAAMPAAYLMGRWMLG